MPQEFDALPFHIDHIIAQQHSGRTTSRNLALACYNCNLHKGPNIAGLDPDTGKLTRLFNPRLDKWVKHFRWSGATLEGDFPDRARYAGSTGYQRAGSGCDARVIDC